MGLEVIALFTQMIEAGTSIALEADRRRKSKDTRKLFEAMKGLNVKTLSELVGPLTFASFTSGRLEASVVQEILDRVELRSLARELFLTSLAYERDSTEVATVQASINAFTSTRLSQQTSATEAEEFAAALTNHLESLAFAAKDALSQADPSMLVQLQQSALLKRLAATLETITKHNDAIARISDLSATADNERFLTNYRQACIERHGYITPPDFETNRKIPLEQLYVAPSLRRPSNLHIDSTIDVSTFIERIDRTVVLGDPGGGKSTLASFVTANVAKRSDGAIPIHVTLRDYAGRSDDISLLDFIVGELAPRYQMSPQRELIEDLLLTGSAIVVLDGLDELIDTTKRREVTKSVELFGIQYPHARILVTSRRVGYEQARLDPAIFSTFLIDGFEDAEVERYVEKWFRSQTEYSDQEAGEQARAFIDQSRAVPDLRSNPLMLALMCIIFRGENYIPRHRPAIYEKCATLLFEKWDGHRGIEVPLQARDHVDAAMKYIAYEFITANSGETGLPEGQVVRMLADYLQPRAFESTEGASHAAHEFVRYCAGRAWVFTEAGATAAGEPIFTFAHRTFMEYFAAVHLTRISDTPESLAHSLLPKVARQEWDVVAQLAVQKIDGTTDRGTSRALEAMLREKRKRTVQNRGNVLSFIARCMSFAIVPPGLVRDIAKACVTHAAQADLAESPHENFESMRPLAHLHEHTSGSDALYAAEQVGQELGSYLQSGDHSEKVWWIVLSRLANDQLEELSNSRVEHAWATMFIEFVRAHLKTLPPPSHSAIFLAQMQAWRGTVSVQHSWETISAAAPAFCDRYFTKPWPQHPVNVGYSLAQVLFSTQNIGRRNNLTEHQRSFLDSLARGIVADFATMERVLPRKGQGDRFGYSSLLFYRPSPEDPVVYNDARLIVCLSTIEILLAYEPFGSREVSREALVNHWLEGDANLLDLTRDATSEGMMNFLERWLEGSDTVFSVTE